MSSNYLQLSELQPLGLFYSTTVGTQPNSSSPNRVTKTIPQSAHRRVASIGVISIQKDLDSSRMCIPWQRGQRATLRVLANWFVCLQLFISGFLSLGLSSSCRRDAEYAWPSKRFWRQREAIPTTHCRAKVYTHEKNESFFKKRARCIPRNHESTAKTPGVRRDGCGKIQHLLCSYRCPFDSIRVKEHRRNFPHFKPCALNIHVIGFSYG